MEAKELQIGDWVYIFDPDYKEEKEAYKVSEIREDGIRTYMFNDTYEEDWFEPITLTPEILENNGFFVYMSTFSKVKTKFYSSYELLKKGIVFSVENDQDINSFIRIDNYVVFKLNYIHELQHLLRMCKMIDKSDNFKCHKYGI